MIDVRLQAAADLAFAMGDSRSTPVRVVFTRLASPMIEIAADVTKLAESLSQARATIDRFAARSPRKIERVRPACGPSAAAGRNERCPCGSGRKFKTCCRGSIRCRTP